jgi:hypothetical protein
MQLEEGEVVTADVTCAPTHAEHRLRLVRGRGFLAVQTHLQGRPGKLT